MVDEEELALVVADDVAEFEGAVDDLLRGADGEGGLAHEIFEAGTVSVDGRVVEVRAEFGNGVLGVLPHEDLAAEADDRLLLDAVPVMLETFAIKRDHSGGVRGRPEDVVVEESVAVVGGLLRDFGGAD